MPSNAKAAVFFLYTPVKGYMVFLWSPPKGVLSSGVVMETGRWDGTWRRLPHTFSKESIYWHYNNNKKHLFQSSDAHKHISDHA